MSLPGTDEGDPAHGVDQERHEQHRADVRPSSGPGGRHGMLYVVVCGAGPAPQVGRLVTLAQARGWEVAVTLTPAAAVMVPPQTRAALEAATGHAVRDDWYGPHRPRAAAVAVTPATYNTVNKWAAGIADTYALGILAELTGAGVPVAVLPFVNRALAANAVFDRSVALLREQGVRVLYGPGGFVPHPPGAGGDQLEAYPWVLVLDALERATHER